jgi:hypothetical protein
MAFLDNSGDIILDAVLTDTGRARLAKGDGSFKIAKFAFGDDEINYSSYNGNHASGSAYYDLEILQTPIFEAFTNNGSTMKSKLVSLTNNNLLFLPVLKLNQVVTQNTNTAQVRASDYGVSTHVVLVDSDTVAAVTSERGILNGTVPTSGGNLIRVDQGLDTTEISPSLILDPELKETQYIVEIDSRFAKVYDKSGEQAAANPSFIDDDSIASYYFTQNIGGFVQNSVTGQTDPDQGTVVAAAVGASESILGPRGTRLEFGLLAATDLVSSTYLFTTMGDTLTDSSAVDFYFIDSTIRVIGVTTGYKLDIPVRFLKKQ